ncbi:AASS [Cordylochernes scorpioides]|uniref:AASS n=1 Tax=Cordylochernes scorpioides TaxID=51811 RepID=A0ABY6LCH7_9ARAC|nr:AASS [Cordylochernes scorpioides]
MVAMARWDQMMEIPEGGYVMNYVDKVEFLPGFNLEGFPNLDSLTYKGVYGLQSAHTMMRCTLRFQGFSAVLQELNRIGLLSPVPHPALNPAGPDISWVGCR